MGQPHILAPGKLLWRIVKADRPANMILYGPPGTGKTSLARVIAHGTRSEFLTINAVLGGVKDIRDAIDTAHRNLDEQNRRTILFIDEVHRFNKSQQDALLPHTESGVVIFIGATTENPYFEVNKALVSRSRVFEMKSLDEAELHTLLKMALEDEERGFGAIDAVVTDEAAAHWVRVANGDARSLLNALELAVMSTEPDEQGRVVIDLDTAEQSIQRKAALYDKDGDAHFDIVSAFIKSMRGSDPDAALYWMARMLRAGEDPKFIMRRMVIFAAEDVGMADPDALGVVVDASRAFDFVGMPEGRFHLSMACLYLSTAIKSNSSMALFDALKTAESEADADPPNPLKDASRDKEGLNHGKGYLYPHAFKEHWVAQQYLPSALMGRVFYQPTGQGREEAVRLRVAEKRLLQLQMLAENDGGKTGKGDGYWEERTFSGQGENLIEMRGILTGKLEPTPSAMFLVLNAESGYLIPKLYAKGQSRIIYAQARTEEQKQIQLHALRGQIPEEALRVVLEPDALALLERMAAERFRFDFIVGRGAFHDRPDKPAFLKALRSGLLDHGQARLLEPMPADGQRISLLLAEFGVPAELVQSVDKAEEELRGDAANPKTNWSRDTIEAAMADAGFVEHQLEPMIFRHEMVLTLDRIRRILPAEGRLLKRIEQEHGPDMAARLKSEVAARMQNQKCFWRSAYLFIRASA